MVFSAIGENFEGYGVDSREAARISEELNLFTLYRRNSS
jgi:hypothetical protein